MVKEFKNFALRGNIVDLAVGVIIGGAFNKIVTSLVNDIIMPFFSIFLGRIEFSNLFFALDGKHYDTIAQAEAANVGTIKYGIFITNVIDFLIVAFTLFIFVRQINRIKNFKKNAEEENLPSTKDCPYCKTSIHIEATRCPHCTSEL
ncbi:MAG: large conductance mechanosensitive channel protein MscL [Clostridiaceae bacterium]|nr:large conductance mechanosensitive channel protein MscL [Clostridiaceae bacterium]